MCIFTADVVIDIGLFAVTVAAIVAYAVCLGCENAAENVLQTLNRLCIEGVIDVLPLAAVVHKTYVHQQFHVMRQRGLRDVECLQYPAGAQLSAGQHINYPQALGVGYCFQYLRRVGIYLLQNYHLI